jgi:PAS domain S-box-containing protein
MPLRLRLGSMTAALTAGTVAAVAIACAAGAYLYSVHHFETLLDEARQSALAQGELVHVALEHQMLENDRSLIARMVSSFGAQPGIENVVVLDRSGNARFSSRPLAPGNDLTIGSPTCQACHQYPADQRGSSRVIETKGSTVLRTVIPIRNREQCHKCHNPTNAINGILIVDTDTAAIRATMHRDMRWMVLGSGVLMLFLVAVIALIVRVVVLRRLQRFETTARMIAAGDLARRVPAQGSDTISWLAQEFNVMADSVTGLLTEVKDQRERLETVINSIDDGIVVLDRGRKVIAANDAFLHRTARRRGDVLNCGCREVSAGMCQAADCPTVACLRFGERQVRIFERPTADGSIAWEEVHASPVRGPNGAIVQVVEVWRDISERRAAEARLAESHRLASLGLLASGFSHELNTPLGTVLACVEGILRETQRGGTSGPDLSHIGGNAQTARDQLLRCRGITQHFLRMSRGQTSPGDIVNLQAAVAAVVRLIEPTARAHGVAVTLVSAPDPVLVRADESEVQHALMNLVLNAVQACGSGGKVAVALACDDAIHVRITDNGCGIPPEHQKRIFEPFFSLRKGGTGLGLFLSLNFVRRWGGDITVHSAPEAGSTFEIVFPAMAAAEQRSA